MDAESPDFFPEFFSPALPGGSDPQIPAKLFGMTLDNEQLAFANAIWNPDKDIVMANAMGFDPMYFGSTPNALTNGDYYGK